MATASSHSWMPVSGRVNVDVGSSLGRALKARKGGPPPKPSKLPDRDFYSFRYNFKPDSVDTTKPGVIDIRKGETTKVTVERASTQSVDAGHLFVGTEQPAKDVDCVLIYDENTGHFTLEKLDSSIILTHDRKTTKAPRLPGSPLPVSLPSTSASSPDSGSVPSSHSRRAQPHTAAERLEAELSGDANGAAPSPRSVASELPSKPLQSKKEIAKSKAPPIPKVKRPVLPPRKEEEEASEGEILEIPRVPNAAASVPSSSVTPAPKPKPKQRNLPSAAAAVRAGSGKSSPIPPPPHHPLPPKPVPSPAKAAAPSLATKRGLPEDSPAPEPKRTRVSPPPKPALSRPARPPPPVQPAKPEKKEVSLAFPDGTGLALPSSSGAPSKPASLAFPGSESVAPVLPPAPVPPPPVVAGDDDSDDDEWDDVIPNITQPAPAPVVASSAPPPPPLHAIVMEEIVPEPSAIQEEDEEEEEQEIDLDMFAEEMDQHLGGDDEEDDFLAAAISPTVDSQPPSGPIMSMNQLAASAEDNIWGDDDYSSSSEDSDDD